MNSYRVVVSTVLAAAVGVGCGSSSGSPPAAATPDSGATAVVPDGGIGSDGRIVAACQAFPLVGLQYSPGGETLPNHCTAFDPVTNNPYAIRCIDAMPSYKTPYAGDDLCILPPPPDKGVQIGAHPQGADYWSAMSKGDMSGYQNPDPSWILAPGEEVTQNCVDNVTGVPANNYYREYFRMRTGTHHNIITLNENPNNVPDGWIPLVSGQEASPALFSSGGVGSLAGIVGGSQRPADQNPESLDKPAEDQGYFFKWPANPAAVFNMHHINATATPMLREAWVNLWWEPDATVPESWFMGLPLSEVMSLDIPPGTVADLHYSWTVGSVDAGGAADASSASDAADTPDATTAADASGDPDTDDAGTAGLSSTIGPSTSAGTSGDGGTPIRFIRAFGHRHFWDTNFSAWLVRSGSTTPEVLYQSFDWENIPTYVYNGETANPTPNPATHLDGAASGIIMLYPGDELHFNCHIEYTDARAAMNGNAPSPESNGPLRFANETFKAEMCLLYGNTTGELGFPNVDTTALPSFATQ